MQKETSIHIIGAGVSGLVCALELERAGLSPVILEKTDRVGGRVKTDFVEGCPLDHGFQVLLTAYPAARRYLDFDKLDLRYFQPGSAIFHDGKKFLIGDPLRHPGLLWPTLTSPVGTISDKLRILTLTTRLKAKSIQQIFEEPETSTLDYLTRYGFSERIISTFFKPFFSGIFLESKLETSSRMFEFVFKLFSGGHATVPAMGIQAIPDQLKGQLKRTRIRFSVEVGRVEPGLIHLVDGTAIDSQCTVLATDPAPLVGSNALASSWNACINLYFEVPKSVLNRPMIGLVGDSGYLINNFHFLSDLHASPGKCSILSVTVIGDPSLGEEALLTRIKKEIQELLGIDQHTHLASYPIKNALPRLSKLTYRPDKDALRLGEGIFIAGDQTANPSLNAAMESGYQAAEAVVKAIEA